jgi:hypothetical protein
MSGCRILAQESSRDKEEKDFSTWFGVEQGSGNCSEINNSELKVACQTPGVVPPKPTHEFLPGSIQVDTASIQASLDRLRLKEYLGAASGDPSLCHDDQKCLEMMDWMKYWTCADKACDSTGKSAQPAICFGKIFSDASPEIRKKMNELICPFIKSPGKDSRRALITALGSEGDEVSFVFDLANLMAFKGDAKFCQEHIKDYLGPYGSQWKAQWYAKLSGCRILARESTVEQEQEDFVKWFAVVEGTSNCSGIMNSELKNACSTPGAKSPKPVAEK